MCYTKFKKEIGKNKKEVGKMKKTPNLLLFILAGITAVSCTACSTGKESFINTNESLLISSNANTQGTVHVKGIVSNTDVKTDSDNITQIYTTHF